MHKIKACSLLLSVIWLQPIALAQPDDALERRASAIHDRVMTLDTHVDIPFDFATGAVDPAFRTDAQVDLQKMEDGGLDVVFSIVYVGQQERNETGYAQARRDALTKFDAIHRMTDDLYGSRIGFAATAREMEAIHAQGKLVAMIGIENGFVIGKDLSVLEDFRNRGARYMTLVHNGHNDIGDSAQPQERLGDSEQEHGGLSDFGYEVVDELNRLGILVDISHVSRQTMLDATRHSRAPVIASHSSVTSVADHPRNMNDEQLLALQENGGVVHIVAFDSYVKLVPPEKTAAMAELRESLGVGTRTDLANLSTETRNEYDERLATINATWPRSNVSEFIDHIDYAVNFIGIDHVGISSDFGGGGGVVGWGDASETGNVTLELVRRGYSESDIVKLWSGNILRILAKAEEISASSR
ncbi:MAG: dipeptidase [Gammaproteobacteria bacterium]|nr:dipeptidase [Gammaproteobacteria bacterium]